MNSDQIAAAARLWAEGVPSKDIGARLGFAKATINKLAWANPDRFPKRADPREELIARAAEMWRDGYKQDQIATALGVNSRRVGAWAEENRDRFPSRKRSEGARHASEIVAAAKKRSAVPQMDPEWPARAPGHQGVTSSDLDACGCTFPLWGHHEEFDYRTSLYCGAPRASGSYCGFHCKESVGQGTRSERAAVSVLERAARAGE